MTKIIIEPLGRLECFCNWLMKPVMYVGSGTFSEESQQTHPWNNMKLNPSNVAYLEPSMMVWRKGIAKSGQQFLFFFPTFHIPLLGGWRDYVVLEPVSRGEKWYVGWIAGNVIGVSRIPIAEKVRVLIGPGDVSFFGVDDQGIQVVLGLVGCGKIGKGGPFAQVPLL